MKRILILSDINSAHTQRWVKAIAASGFEIGIFTLSKPASDWYKTLPNVTVLFSNDTKENTFAKGSFSKLKFIRVVPELNAAIKRFQPDLMHAHYATSYGLIGVLSKFHPFIISAWGSDVMEFPFKSFLHKWLVRFNLKKADLLFATSNAIQSAIVDVKNDIAVNKIKIIPFGIDTDVFKPMQVDPLFQKDAIVIGTIKSLEHIYGIDILIKAFKIISDKHPDLNVKLLLVGGGSREAELKSLVNELNLDDKTVFAGKVPYDKVPSFHNRIDVFVNVSRNESFGVAILEASASEKPVVATDIGGLKEVVVNGKTGFLVEPENVNKVAEAIEMLILNKTLCKEMGEQGRVFVKEKYEFSFNVKETIRVYEQLIEQNK